MSDKAKFFEKAAADVVKHVKELSDDKKLKLYGLYKLYYPLQFNYIQSWILKKAFRRGFCTD
jgi:hypothetical protein